MVIGTAGMVFHVVNRGVRRARLFDSDADYQACLVVLATALRRHPADLLAYCLMPNHFHLVIRPLVDGQMSHLMQWFTATHSRQWHLRRGTVGTGAVYQGRFKAFPVQTDAHFLTVCRYVERNALRAGLVSRVEDWPWSSLADRVRIQPIQRLASWPVERPENWAALLNGHEPIRDLRDIRRATRACVPFGTQAWSRRVGATLKVLSAVQTYENEMSS